MTVYYINHALGDNANDGLSSGAGAWADLHTLASRALNTDKDIVYVEDSGVYTAPITGTSSNGARVSLIGVGNPVIQMGNDITGVFFTFGGFDSARGFTLDGGGHTCTGDFISAPSNGCLAEMVFKNVTCDELHSQYQLHMRCKAIDLNCNGKVFNGRNMACSVLRGSGSYAFDGHGTYCTVSDFSGSAFDADAATFVSCIAHGCTGYGFDNTQFNAYNPNKQGVFACIAYGNASGDFNTSLGPDTNNQLGRPFFHCFASAHANGSQADQVTLLPQDPFVDAANGDFRLNDTAAASLLKADRGPMP